MILALRALDVGPGDEVITASHTALATISAIVSTGANPVLVDIDPIHYTIVPECIQNAITKNTRAIIPIHLYGQSADMDEIMKIAKEHNLKVVEDCAQAVGATYKGRITGSMGVFGCFSFYPTKNLGALGDGGALVTDDGDLAERLIAMRQYGWHQRFVSTPPFGRNSRLDELQAAILRVKLPHVLTWNAKRRVVVEHYRDALADQPLHRQTSVTALIGNSAELPATEASMARIMSLPCFPGIKEVELDAVITAVQCAGLTPHCNDQG